MGREKKIKGSACLKVNPRRPRERDLRRAAAVLKNGGVITLPTDTVYGLAADPFNPAAVARLFRLKGRDDGNPVACLVSDARQAKVLAKNFPPSFWSLARRYWPGGLTLIVPKAPSAGDWITRGLPGIGLRQPDSPWVCALAKALGRPVAATSANLSGRPPQVNGSKACLEWGGKVELLVDGGDCPQGVASSVVSCLTRKPRLLRAGKDEVVLEE